ncbi:MAG: Ig-like domain-containing protein [Methanobacteriaceae archaeon]|jgi:hypothetical protein|nr:Ig-like domain-containing protein [Methanobacteriaceae archaeon]
MVSYNIQAKFTGDTQSIKSTSNTAQVNTIQATPRFNFYIPDGVYNLNDPVQVLVQITDITTTAHPENGTSVTLYKNGIASMTQSLDQGGTVFNTTMSVNGVNAFYVVMPETSTFFGGTSPTVTYNIGKQNTNMTITANKEYPDYNTPVTFTATLKNQNNNVISGKQITFKNGNNVIGTATTNSQGQATISSNMTIIGSNTISATFAGDVGYNSSNNSTSVSVQKIQTIIERVSPSPMYKGWELQVRVKSANGALLTNTNVDFLINGVTYSRNTDSSGIAKMTINLSGVSMFTFSATCAGNSTQSNASITGVVSMNQAIMLETKPHLVQDAVAGIPNRSWNSFLGYYSDPYAEATDNYFIRCGSSANTIASRVGTWNTPAPLNHKDFNFRELVQSIESFAVVWISRYDYTSNPSSAIDCGYGTIYLINDITGERTAATGQTKPGIKEWIQNEVTLENPNLTGNDLMTERFWVQIAYDKNSTTNVGTLDIGWVSLKITYIPKQNY